MISTFGTVTKGLLKGLEDLEIRRRVETIQLLHYWEWPEYWEESEEESWRLEETCCNSNSSKRPSTKTDVKNSQGWVSWRLTPSNKWKWKIRSGKNISGELENYETKLSNRSLIKGINTWAVPLVRYSGPFLKWTRDELKQMNQRTRKLMTMHNALHSRDDVDRLYVPRKEGGRGLTSIKDSIDASIQRLKDYIEKHKRGLITAIRNDTDNMIDDRTTTTRKQKWKKKQLYNRFKWLINNISHQKTWTWLRKRNLKRETESLLIAAQDNAIRTNHIKARIDKTQQSSICRLCSDRDKTINHIISECSKLTQKEYKARHDWVG